MKIIHLNTVCKTGSIGKIVYGLHKQLKENGHESVICYGRGNDYIEEPDLIRIANNTEVYIHALFARLTGNTGMFSNKATKRFLKILEEVKPDVVHLYNLHGYYINEFSVLNYLKKNGIRTVYSMLDEYPYMGKCCYSYDCNKFKTECGKCPEVKSYPKSLFFDRSKKIFNLKKDAYHKFENIVFTAPQWVINRAKSSALLRDKKFATIDEFVDLENVFYPRNTAELRSKLGIKEDKLIVLTVAPFLDPRKGGIYYLNLAKLLESENIVFIHVGYNGQTENLPKNFIPVGFVANQNELATFYSLADLFVCTSLADTMPNVCLDALSCGTPVSGFDAAGTPFVASKEFGTFTLTGNVEALASVVKNTPKKNEARILACRNYAKTRYSSKIFCEKILNVYSTLNIK